MKLVKKRLSGYGSGSELELATLNQYIWQLENNLKGYDDGVDKTKGNIGND